MFNLAGAAGLEGDEIELELATGRGMTEVEAGDEFSGRGGRTVKGAITFFTECGEGDLRVMPEFTGFAG